MINTGSVPKIMEILIDFFNFLDFEYTSYLVKQKQLFKGVAMVDSNVVKLLLKCETFFLKNKKIKHTGFFLFLKPRKPFLQITVFSIGKCKSSGSFSNL
jgi:hypothetical protein